MRHARSWAVVGLALALACAPSNRAAELVFWQSAPPGLLGPMLARFEAEHLGVHVRAEQLPPAQARARVTEAAAKGRVPDLCEVSSDWLPGLLASGKLADWSAGAADLKPLLHGWEMCSLGDAVYGVPWTLETRALFWNKALFARAGLDSTQPPETWLDVERAALAIRRLGVHGFGLQGPERGALARTFLSFVWSAGGSVLSPDLHHVTFESPATRVALEFYTGLRQADTLSNQAGLDRAFARGRLGLAISGPWLPAQLAREAPGLRYGVALVPAPAADRGTHAAWAGGEVLVSFNAAKHKALALALARFLARPENARAAARRGFGREPATAGADTSADYRGRPREQLLLRQIALARYAPNHPVWDQMEAAIEDEVALALADRKTAAQAVRDAQAKLAALVGKS